MLHFCLFYAALVFFSKCASSCVVMYSNTMFMHVVWHDATFPPTLYCLRKCIPFFFFFFDLLLKCMS